EKSVLVQCSRMLTGEQPLRHHAFDLAFESVPLLFFRAGRRIDHNRSGSHPPIHADTFHQGPNTGGAEGWALVVKTVDHLSVDAQQLRGHSIEGTNRKSCWTSGRV